MTAAELKTKLYARHPASSEQMPGAWTCIEEYRGIDLLAFSAWSSAAGGRYARIGYEVKVSRSDLRSELLNPAKRARNVEWCNEFYLAVPVGLLTAEELAFEEPEWAMSDFVRAPCPRPDADRGWRTRSPRCREEVPVPAVKRYDYERYQRGYGSAGWKMIPCRTCGGTGTVGQSRVEAEAPTLWIPRDVGLVTVDGRGTKLVKKAPRRKDVPALRADELGQFARWISMRPDPRHAPRRERHVEQRKEVAA